MDTELIDDRVVGEEEEFVTGKALYVCPMCGMKYYYFIYELAVECDDCGVELEL
ncbi:MAG: hypothetical protein GY840_05260 [Pseudoalteromonas sp.]|nr:hypothetical protein [Pseudoalteromonas sp.]